MPEAEHLLRGVLFASLLAAVCMAGPAGRRILPHRSWPLRLVFVGLSLYLVYGLTGQVKALVLDIPFDAVSYLGLTASLTMNAGSVWFLAQQRRLERK